MPGTAAVAMWWDIDPGMQAEIEDWHTHEHMPERLSIPGFLRGTRWRAVDGKGSYFILYEVESLATITSGPYLARLNDPTPWSRKMMPHHLNMVRSLCRIESAFGAGTGGAMLTLRFSPAPRPSLTDLLRALPERKGLAAAWLLRDAARAEGGPTAEQKIRGGDATADWVVLVNAYDADALRSLTAELVPGAVARVYELAYQLTSAG